MKICLSCEGISATEQENCGSCGIPLLLTEAVHYPVRRGEVDAANPLLGTMLDGKYRVASVLGRGGMGTVYRAVHAVSLVPVALKLLHPRYGSRPDYRRAFLAEARKAGRVVHDHCARVLDVGETEDGTAYLAMELADGETLEEWTRGGRGLGLLTVVEILEQVCRALVAIHQAGLVHRDLSARNVMVSVRNGAPVVKVLDFGIAKAAALVARNGQVDVGAEPQGFANPVFSAPEHLAGQQVDARADLYSLGVIGYLLLTGSLPVIEHDPGEAARATVAGRLRPLPKQPGTARRLRRLIVRCLQLDPDLRPASASLVLDELAHIRAAPRQRARQGWFALLAAAIAALVMFLAASEVYLRPVAGSTLVGFGQNSPVLYRTSANLAKLSFHYGGFSLGQLRVEVSRDGSHLATYPLNPVPDSSSGHLVLSTAQTGWGAAVSSMALASAEGPLDVQFLVPGQAPLGGVKLFVDDVPPLLHWSLHEASEEVCLNSHTVLDYRLEDRGGVADAGVVLELPDGTSKQLTLPVAGNSLALGRELQTAMPGLLDRGRGTLVVWARDQAGNRKQSDRLTFLHCDLAAPAVLSVSSSSEAGVVNYTSKEATLRLRLSGWEEGLQVSARDADDRDYPLLNLRPLVTGTAQIEMRGREDHLLQPFASGEFTFRVRDTAGNLSESPLSITFRNRRTDAVLQPAASEPPSAVRLGEELVLAHGGARLEFHCNEAFTLETARLLDHDAVPRVVESVSGRAALTVPALPPGSYQLVLRLNSDGGGEDIEQKIRVLPEQIELRVPASTGRFLPELLADNVLKWHSEELREELRDGGWSIEPALRPYLRGNVWHGGSVLTPALMSDAPDALVMGVRPVNGRNVLALELHDVLNRSVSVLVGGQKAPTRPQDGARGELAEVAVFLFHRDGPVPVGKEVLVEHGQPARILVRTALPFTEQDRARIHLRFGPSDVTPGPIEPSPEGGAVLTFLVPSVNWTEAANLKGVGREEYGRGQLSPVKATLVTPAGQHELQFSVRTTRSLLVPFRLGDLSKRALTLPPPLRDLLLVPVLAPDGVLADPVPADLPGRGLFRHRRPQPVRNWSDYYLQDRELTLGQYAALCRSWFELDAAERPAWQRIVHADDPLGEGRLRPEAMVPRSSAGRDAVFQELAQAAPDQALAGVDWYQAHAAVCMLGVLIDDNPDLLRLPLGCELEFAALGAEAPAGVMHGAAVREGGVYANAFTLAGERWKKTGAACTAKDCEVAGDLVPTNFRRDASATVPFLGLDFGVREWVLDLPEGSDSNIEAQVLGGWVGDHDGHVLRCRDLATGKELPLREMATRLRTMAVVRGLALGESSGLISARTGGTVTPPPGGMLPDDVPGVVRTEQMPRDGRGLSPGSLDPRLLRTGFRVAGGSVFAQQVRGR